MSIWESCKREYYKFFNIPAYKIEIFDGIQLKEAVYTTQISDGSYSHKKHGSWKLPERADFMDGTITLVRVDTHYMMHHERKDDKQENQEPISEGIKQLTAKQFQDLKEDNSIKKVIATPKGKYDDLTSIIIIMTVAALLIAALAIVFGKV